MNVTYERFCFPVTLRCNLRCRLCAEHSPYYKNPYHPTFVELTDQLDALFGLVEHIGKFDITGGEPFLRNDLPDVIRYLFEHCRTKIGRLRVTTNGTLLPPVGFVEAAKLWGSDFYIIVDRYPASGKSGGGAAEALKAAGIPHELRDYSDNLHCDGWVDYGDLKPKHTKEEAKEVFKKCAVPKLGFFSCMVNGVVFPCSRARLLYERRIAGAAVDLFDDELTEEGKKARLNALLGVEAMEACRFCNGLCEDSPRFTPAEQLTVSGEQTREMMEYEDWQLHYGKMLFYTQTYNNEKTIGRTIQSVLNQTNQDFTYFICNNGSADKTGEIIRKYAAGNGHVIYVENERNDVLALLLVPFRLFSYIPRDLDNYYCIVDGDDSIEPVFLEKVLDIALEQDVDMVVPAYTRRDAETGGVINQRSVPKDVIVSGRGKADGFVNYRAMLLCQWGKMYKLKSLNNKDSIFLWNCRTKLPKWFNQLDTVNVLGRFYQFDRVAFISEPVYNYFVSTKMAYYSYLPHRIRNDVSMFQIYIDFLERFGPVSKRNRDYCFAIYLSLLYDNLLSLFNTRVVGTEQILDDILDILQAGETKQLLSGDFDPEFRNLANRQDFIQKIRGYLESLPPRLRQNPSAKGIEAELEQYGYGRMKH